MFDIYLRKHVEQFAYKSITTPEWKAFLYQHFADQVTLLSIDLPLNIYKYIFMYFDVFMSQFCFSLSALTL